MLGVKLAFFVALLAVLSGCGSSIDLDFPSAGKLGLTIRDGANTTVCDVEANSPGVTAVAAWLDSNRDDWHSSMVTYAPTVQLNGDGFSINFVGGLAVINHSSTQLTHRLSEDVYGDLVCP